MDVAKVFLLIKVPGDFHLSFHAHRDLISELSQEQYKKLEMSHEVVSLSFEVLG
jgi:hypothetical protein